MPNSNGEFKGSVKESIADLKADVQELKNEVANQRKWLTVLSILVTIAVIERIPDFLHIITAVAAGN